MFTLILSLVIGGLILIISCISYNMVVVSLILLLVICIVIKHRNTNPSDPEPVRLRRNSRSPKASPSGL